MEQKDAVAALERDTLQFHSQGRPGKIEITPTKALVTQRDLSLAYSPGVAYPCLHIAADPSKAYDYTAKGNLVAVISNGTAVLGLGDLGALAGKPVMEGKAVLFKRFADIDGIDLEVDTKDVDAFVNCVRYLGPTFGGINLEDIKAPECFIIEQRLRELMDIPVFHDDQHGTAIIAAAGLVNALHLTGRDLKDIRLVVNGAGAAAIACVELVKSMGVPHQNVILCDTKGGIYQGRTEGMNQWKSAHAVETPARSLEEAMKGADVFFGLSAKGAVTPEMVAGMADRPIIFAMANPDPEITPEEVKAVRTDAIVATGRSDYANQINNVLGFPYIFRGALDVRASTINDQMKIAAVHALADLAREDVPDEVDAAYSGRRLRFGPDYIIPVPFDPRLISAIPPAVAKAAMDSGVARKPIEDMEAYRASLAQRLDPTAAFLQKLQGSVLSAPKKRIVFTEGEEPSVIRAAYAFQNAGLGSAILIGREELVHENMLAVGLDPAEAKLEILNARLSHRNAAYVDHLYERLQRVGYLRRDVQRLINQDRNAFGASMVALGDADGMVTGVTRSFDQVLEEVLQVVDPVPGGRMIGMSVVLAKGRTIFIADTSITEMPVAEDLVEIAKQAATAVRTLGYEPRVAFMSYSTFGNPMGLRSDRVRDAVTMLDGMEGIDFEYEGEMPPELALEPELRGNYPFMRLTGPANVLIMPAVHSAAISTQLIQSLGGATVIGPILLGLDRAVQICPLSASVSKILQMATVCAYERQLVETDA